MILWEASNETNRDSNGGYLLYGSVARDGANDVHIHFDVNVEADNKTNRKFSGKTNVETSIQTGHHLGRHGNLAAAGGGGTRREGGRREHGQVAFSDV